MMMYLVGKIVLCINYLLIPFCRLHRIVTVKHGAVQYGIRNGIHRNLNKFTFSASDE